MPGLPVFSRKLEGVADTQEAFQGDCHSQPPATEDEKVEWVEGIKEVDVLVNGKKCLCVLLAKQ